MQPGADRARFTFFNNPADAAKGADFVQESGPEREDTKIDLFAVLDAAAPPETVIATSSSGLLVSRVSTKCRHPERCVIGHPFNPPHLIPLVEVVGGPKTSAEAIVRAMDFYPRPARSRSTSRRKWRAMSPTGCRRRSGAK